MLPDGGDHAQAVREHLQLGVSEPTRYSLRVTQRGRDYYGAGGPSFAAAKAEHAHPDVEREQFAREVKEWERDHPRRTWSARLGERRVDIDAMPEKADLL